MKDAGRTIDPFLARYLERRAELAGGMLYISAGTRREKDDDAGADAQRERGGKGQGEGGGDSAGRGESDGRKGKDGDGKSAGSGRRKKREQIGEREEGLRVKTSPAGSPGSAGSKGGITRDTRRAVQNGLFDAPSSKGPDVSGLGLSSLEKAVSECTLCSLSKTRTKTVFGDGDPGAGIVFIGEAPGRDEDLQGVPFVGRAGRLLDKIIESIGLVRGEVYIANILKCRPPGNRDPNEEEVACCERYLARQLELIDPVVICALGRVAGQNLLDTKAPLRAMRGEIHRYNGVPVIVTYHPAALLRNPNLKRDAWEDMKELRRLYDELREGRSGAAGPREGAKDGRQG